MGPDSAKDAVKTKGLEIFRLMGAETPAIFGRGWWAGRMIQGHIGKHDAKGVLPGRPALITASSRESNDLHPVTGTAAFPGLNSFHVV